MRLLIIGNSDTYSNQRILLSAQQAGHSATIAHMTDIDMGVADGKSMMTIKEYSLSDFDTVLFRNLHPQFISAYLAFAQKCFRNGLTIANPTLVDRPFVWNKLHQMMTCADALLCVPSTIFITSEQSLKHITSFPVVMKPLHGSHGVGIVRCDRMNDVRAVIAKEGWGTYFAQSYLDANYDYRVMVVGGAIIGAVKKTPVAGEFRTNSDFGSTFTPYEPTREMSHLATSCASLFSLPIAGVDMREHDGVMHIMEVNRNPSFELFEQATDIDVGAAIIDYLETL